jgi:hypothetical protein
MKTRTLVAAVAVALLALCLVLVMRHDSDSNPAQAPNGVSLAFHGLTNLPTKGNVAVFFVTNAGPERVAFSPDAFEYRDGQVWVTNSLRNQRRDGWLYWYHDLTGNLRLGNWYDFGGDLEPGASALFAAPMLVTNAPWRLHFYCVEQATGVQGIADRTRDLVQHTASVITNGAARNQATFSGRRYYLISRELSQ